MGDTSDDFFNDFNSPAPPPKAKPRPPPGVPPTGSSSASRQRRPPPGGPPPGAPPAGTVKSRPPQTTARQQPKQQQQPSYILNAPTPAAAAPSPSHYGGAQQQTPQQSAVMQDYSNGSNNDGDDDWYGDESVGKSNAVASAASNPYASTSSPHIQQQPAVSATAPYNANAYQQQPNQQQPANYGQFSQPQYNSNVAATPAVGGGFNSSSQHGSMDGSMNGSGSAAGMFVPQEQQPGAAATAHNDLDDLANEPPLLEELGINLQHIYAKTKAVVVPFRRFQSSNTALSNPTMIVEEADLAGPLVFAMALGGELLLSGKVSFGYIYSFSMFGCVSMTAVLNLMSPEKPVNFWVVTSILGYALLPVNILAFIKVLLLGHFTQLLAVITVLWSTTASTRLFELGCGLESQRYLLAYPIALLYSAFVLITIF